MENNDEEIIKSFKKAEKQFFSAVKHMPKIEENASNEELKSNIEDYILHIGKLRQMLNDYEESVMVISNNIEKNTKKKK